MLLKYLKNKNRFKKKEEKKPQRSNESDVTIKKIYFAQKTIQIREKQLNFMCSFEQSQWA